MKKIIIATLCLIICFALFACNSAVQNPDIPIWDPRPADYDPNDGVIRNHVHGTFIPFLDIEMLFGFGDPERPDRTMYVIRVVVLDEYIFGDYLALPSFTVFDIHTRNIVQVAEVFQGNSVVPGDIITTNQRGGYKNGHELICNMRISIEIGAEYIIFGNISSSGRFIPQTMQQAIYRIYQPNVDARSEYAPSIVDEGFILSHPNNTLTLTADDLRNAAERNGIAVGGDVHRQATR